MSGWQDKAGRLGAASMLPGAALLLLVFMVVPLPPLLLDIGFIANILISLAVLMVALNVQRALDFSAFPTILLFATLFRLALNVASTRVVLMHGHEGSDAAGHVIEAFGSILVGGDYVVGLLVFSILMIINLIVITKGAGRVSEVSARFTLDALPGKQMAIDADLNAGLISADEARARRQDVSIEADFYGSMDGASKFVKGDAIAGVLILIINIVGGIILGMASHSLSLSEAAQTYVLLAIGDALVAQVPALLLSVAAASVVTRVTTQHGLSEQIGLQFGSAQHWYPVAAILGLLALVPGMPHLMVLCGALGAAAIGWVAQQSERKRAAQSANAAVPLVENPALIRWEDVSDAASISVDIGYGLVPLVDDRKGAPLMQRITGMRKQISRQLGFVLPLVRVRDELELAPNAYRIRVNGVVLGEDMAYPGDLLALATGDVPEGPPLAGRTVKDPSFGLDALWITPDQRADAIVAGYTVVDAPTVIVTHLNQLLLRHADQLFGMDDAKAMIEALKLSAPHLAETLLAVPRATALLSQLCRHLLAEGVAIRDVRPIAETLVQMQPALGDADGGNAIALLGELVRRNLGASIVQEIVPLGMPLPVITLAPAMEGLVSDAVRLGSGSAYPIEPELAQRLVSAVSEASLAAQASHGCAALVTAPGNRLTLARLLRPHLPDLAVLSFLELPPTKAVDVVAVIGGDQDEGPHRALAQGDPHSPATAQQKAQP